MPDGAPVAPGTGLGVATDEVTLNLTGTVSKNGTTTVTGVSTVFLSELSVGQVIRIPGGGGTEDRIVQAIASDTSLTVTLAFTNTAATQVGQRVQHAQLFKLAYSADGVPTLVQVDANGVLVNTELPAAAALSDATANPTSPMVGGANMLWDGTNWIRAKSALGTGSAIAKPQAFAHVVWDSSSSYNETQAASAGDGSSGAFIPISAPRWYNGASFDKATGDVANGLDVDVTRIQGSDIDHDVANTLKNIQVAGHASPVDLPPTAVSAAGDRTRMWVDRFGSQVVRRRKIRESYTAVFRLAETTARLDQTFTLTANTNKQYCTLHHAASATKELILQTCRVWVTLAGTAVFQGIIELRELSVTTAPSSGNPAITGRPHRIGTGAHEATALYLPTTQGSEAAANSPLGSLTFDLGIESATVSTTNPLPGGVDGPAAYTLFDASRQDDQVMAPTAPVGVYGGWAIVFRSTAATVLRATAQMVFTEEIP